jgi:hypothetical protein
VVVDVDVDVAADEDGEALKGETVLTIVLFLTPSNVFKVRPRLSPPIWTLKLTKTMFEKFSTQSGTCARQL